MSERVACPSCGIEYPVPEKLWHSGRIAVRCPHCGKRFVLRFQAGSEPAEVDVPAQATGEKFPVSMEGNDLPDENGIAPARRPDPDRDEALMARRAKRLARALVGDLARGRESERKKSLEDGSLLLIFGEGIRRAWMEFQDQAPEDFPEARQLFREALNEVFAEGKPLF